MNKIKDTARSLRDFIFQDRKIITTVIFTFIGIVLIGDVVGTITDIIQRSKDVPLDLTRLLMWTWFIMYQIYWYKYRALNDEIDDMMHGFFHVLMTIREANKKGIMIQDLEKQGIMKFETIIKDKKTGDTISSDKMSPSEEDVLKKMLEKVTKDKDKLPN